MEDSESVQLKPVYKLTLGNFCVCVNFFDAIPQLI